MGQRYVRVLVAAGAVPWIIPLLEGDRETLHCIYERLDGLFLTGGVDVDPCCYGEERGESCGRTDAPRDWTELTLVRWALEDRLPVLGVCRGIQLINVAAGGTLYQDVEHQFPGALKHDCFPTPGGYGRDSLIHPVQVVPDSRLGKILAVEALPVNSMHHQAVKSLAPGLRPSAFAPDGLIEGIEGTDGQFLVAVQWHPEELAETQPAMQALFAALITAASEFRGQAPAHGREPQAR
jgi:putative glutamine amidotransferase